MVWDQVVNIHHSNIIIYITLIFDSHIHVYFFIVVFREHGCEYGIIYFIKFFELDIFVLLVTVSKMNTLA